MSAPVLPVSGKRAAAVIGGTQREPSWPYGISVADHWQVRSYVKTDEDYQRYVADLHAKQLVLVEWAEKHGLKQARSEACCTAWLLRDRARSCPRGCGPRRSPRIDHMTAWTRDGAPAVVANAPYGLHRADTYATQMTALDDRLRVAWTHETGWYGHLSAQVFLWRSDVIEHVDFAIGQQHQPDDRQNDEPSAARRATPDIGRRAAVSVSTSQTCSAPDPHDNGRPAGLGPTTPRQPREEPMARIETENGETFEIAEAALSGDESGVHFVIEDAGSYLLTAPEARRIATVLTTMANKIDAGNPIRPDVVTLLADVDANGAPDQWTHLDGRPLTSDELDVALSATVPELTAAADRMRRDTR